MKLFRFIIGTFFFVPLLQPVKIKAQSPQDFASITILKEDLNILANGYFSPVLKSINIGMNTTWISSAKTHDIFGFDLRIGSSLVIIPGSEQSFTPIGLEYVKVPTAVLPTLSGFSSSTPLAISIPSTSGYNPISAELDFPGGLGSTLPINAVPIPFGQIGIGLIPNTDILFRGVPNSVSHDVDLGLIGFGVKHKLGQYVGIPQLSPYQFAIFGAYSVAYVSKKLADSEQMDTFTLFFGSVSEPSSLRLETESKTIQFIGSIDLPLITAYATIGYQNVSSTLLARGDFGVLYQGKVNDQLVNYESVIKNPVTLLVNTKSNFVSLGAKLKVLFLHFNGDYTFSEYNTINVGVALTFR